VLHVDRLAPEDRERIQPELDKMVAEYTQGDGILEPPVDRDSLQPPPLRAGRLPPVASEPVLSRAERRAQENPKKAKAAAKSGFGGAGGGGMGMGGGKSAKKKKVGK
jgi:hypothetical protein